MKLVKITIILFGLIAWHSAQAQDLFLDSLEVGDNPLGFETLKDQKKMEHTFIVNYMPGWITSKVLTPYKDYSWQDGQGYEVGYRCLFDSGYGFAFNYCHNQTNYPFGYKLGLDYVGASFVYGGHISKKWIVTTEIGLGYADYTDAGRKMKDGFGTKYALGMENLLGKVVGIGFGLSYHTSTFSKDKDYDYYDSDKYRNGFNRLSFNLGLRIYL